MTEKELANRLIEANGGKPFASLNQVKRILGFGHERTVRFLSDITPVDGPVHGNRVTQYYFIDDVAKQVIKKGLGSNGEN